MMNTAFLISVALYMLALITSIALHESAHAYTAHFFGDRTPKNQGRLSLNPLVHLSLMGTLLPFLALMSSMPLLFGWGKPVLVDHSQMRWNPYCRAVVAGAGSTANLLLCIGAGIGLAFTAPDSLERHFLQIMLSLNAMLCLFNLLPFPPLDGATVLTAVLPRAARDFYEDYLAPYGFYIFLALLISGQISWFMRWVSSIETSAVAIGEAARQWL